MPPRAVPFTPKQDAGSIADRIRDMILDFFHRVLVNQRALHNTGFESVADFQLLRRR